LELINLKKTGVKLRVVSANVGLDIFMTRQQHVT